MYQKADEVKLMVPGIYGWDDIPNLDEAEGLLQMHGKEEAL